MKKKTLLALWFFVVVEITLRIVLRSQLPATQLLTKLPTYSENRLEELITAAETQKPTGEFRIVVTGGSAAFGNGATGPDKTFPARLESKLRDHHPKLNVRVFNAGVGSLQAPDEAYLYLKFLRKLNPNLVIMFSGYNDLREAVMATLRSDPYEEYRKFDKVHLVHEAQPFVLMIATARSIFLSVHNFLKRLSRIYYLITNTVTKFNDDGGAYISEYEPKKAEKEIQNFMMAAAALHELSHVSKAKFWLAIQPMAPCGSFRPSIKVSWLDARAAELYVSALRPNLESYTKTNGINFLDCSGKTVDSLNQMNAFLDPCHLNDAGYDLVADVVHKAIEKDLP